jgi:hypothetical protein
MRFFVVLLVMAVTASTQAMRLGHGTSGIPEKQKLMRDAPQRFTGGQVATVYTTRTTPNLTVPIPTGHRATTR